MNRSNGEGMGGYVCNKFCENTSEDFRVLSKMKNFTKGHNSVKNVLPLCTLSDNTLHFTKFHENIFYSF